MKTFCIDSILNKNRLPWQGSECSEIIEWQFTQYKDDYFPIFFIKCEMSGWENKSTGFGASLSREEGLYQAFGEAWERLWLKKILSDKSSTGILSSNGLAAGQTNQMAIRKSQEELLERAIFLKAWRDQQGWLVQKPKSMTAKLLVLGMKLRGWQVSLFTVSSNLGSIEACLVQNKRKGSFFDTSFVSNGPRRAFEKVLLSVSKGIVFHSGKEVKDESSMPNVGKPIDHLSFYLNPRNQTAFDFLYKKNSSSNTKSQELEFDHVTNMKSQVICEANIFPSVAMSINSKWPELLWGMQSIGGKNKWPHPLA